MGPPANFYYLFTTKLLLLLQNLLLVTLLLLCGDIEPNPGPETGTTFPCGFCDVDANWSNGGIACEYCDVWYHRSCADLNLSSFNRLASTSTLWIGMKCDSKNFSHHPFHYSLLYLTVSNSFDPLSDSKLTPSDVSLNSTSSFVPKVHSTPISQSFQSLGPPSQNSVSTPSFENSTPPHFDYSPVLGSLGSSLLLYRYFRSII